MNVINAAIDHRLTVYVFVVLAAIVGAICYVVLPREAFPEIEIPYISVSTTYRNVGPSEIEESITKEIEKKLKGLEDVEHITSTSSEGASNILVEFEPTVTSEEARRRVRDKVDEAQGLLPPEADDPTVTEIDVSKIPVITVNVYGSAGLVLLKAVADRLSDLLVGIPGVLDAEVTGGLEREIRLVVDRTRLAAYRIPVSKFLALVQAEDRSTSGGVLKMGDFQLSVRVPGEFADPTVLSSFIIETRGGRPIYLSDVAQVEDTFQDPMSIARFDGEPCVSIAVRKRTGENVIRLCDRVMATVEAARAHLPSGVHVDTTLDRSRHIRKIVADLQNNILTALILVVGILMIFMGLRTSLIVAMAIPLTLMISMGLIAAFGISLNMITLFSLVLALGMMVDNSIVIVENIYRHRTEGLGRVEAAKVASREVAWPVVTSTLTTLAAFVPMLFWPGLMGQVMQYLPKTLIIVLSSSLFVALVLNPTFAVAWMPRRFRVRSASDPAPAYVRAYLPILRAALRRRGLTLALAVVALIASIAAFQGLGGQVEFFPRTDPERAYVSITGPVGMRLEATDRLARTCEAATLGFDTIEHRTTTIGLGAGDPERIFSAGAGTSDHLGRISLDFVDYDVRDTPARDTLEVIRGRLTDAVGAEVKVESPQEGPPTGAAVSVELIGPDYQVLVRLAGQVRALVEAVPGATNVKDDLEEGKPELHVVVDRHRAQMLGLNTATIAYSIKAAVNGIKAGVYRELDEEYDIVVRLPEGMRRRVEDLEALTIAGPTGEPIPIGAVARLTYLSGVGSLRRKDHDPMVSVTADALPGVNSRQLLAKVREAMKPLEAQLPSGFRVNYAGEREEEAKARSFLWKAGLIAVLLIALILVTEFTSLALPFIILISVVLSWIGVFAGLTITRMPFGVIMGGVGLISLAGVVVNNAIVLIDYTQQLRRRGMDIFEAVVQAARTRLRPVLLTAITTIIGLVPMAVGTNLDLLRFRVQWRSETSQWWSQMSVVVIFGLAMATLLTLVVVPVLYTLFEGARRRLRR